MYGLELVTELADLGGPDLGSGTVYPLLGRLRREGLVDTTWQFNESGPARRYYRATARGREEAAGFSAAWAPFSAAVSAMVRARG